VLGNEESVAAFSNNPFMMGTKINPMAGGDFPLRRKDNPKDAWKSEASD